MSEADVDRRRDASARTPLAPDNGRANDHEGNETRSAERAKDDATAHRPRRTTTRSEGNPTNNSEDLAPLRATRKADIATRGGRDERRS